MIGRPRTKQKIKLFFIKIVVLSISSLFAPKVAFSNEADESDPRVDQEIILQGFNWESYSYSESGHSNGWYRILTNQVDVFSSLYITSLWLPPPSASFEGDSKSQHSRGYLPTKYYVLDTQYGTEKELRNLLKKLHEKGIKPVADMVLNHRHATGWGWTNGKWCQNLFYDPDWGPEVITKNDLSGCSTSSNLDTGQDNEIFLDLDHLNSKVRTDLISWMKWLRWDVGFRGWRYDQVHGYGGNFVGLYNKATAPDIAFGEFWNGLDYGCVEGLCYNQDKARQDILNWIDSTWSTVGLTSDKAAGAFDFTMRGILKEAISRNEFWRLKDAQGRPPGVIGRWPEKALTFIENHDTGSTQQLWPFSSDPSQVLQGYAYILTHPGIPTIFYDHLFFWKNNLFTPIKDLINIRVRNNIRANASINIVVAQNDLYAAYIDNKIAVKLGPSFWQPPMENGWYLSTYGTNYAVFERK